MSTNRRIEYIEFTELANEYLDDDAYWWVVVVDRATGIAYSAYMSEFSFLRDDVQAYVIEGEAEKFREKLHRKFNNWPYKKVRVQ